MKIDHARKFVAMLLLVFGTVWNTMACTNFIITRGATVDGSVMITYAADSHTLYGELYFKPAKDYPEGAMMDVYEWDTGKWLGRIKQVRHTYSVVGNMNEFQVAIGETTYGGHEELVDTLAKMDYGSLMYIALQRAKTAREAIQVMGQLVAEHGYCSEGESFSVSDPNEAWIFEMIGKGPGSNGAVWVAQRIPDGYISGHANQARITQFPLNDPDNCLYAPDVISFARKKGYFKGEDKDFSFSDTYNPLNYGAVRFCESRVWSAFRRVNASMDKYFAYVNGDSPERMPLWIKPDHKLSAQDVMALMRDHFEGTPFDMTKDIGAGPFTCPYRWRPMEWDLDGKTYVHERATSTQQTGFSFIAQSRGWLPNPIGGINWFGVDDTYSTVYVPMYCGINRAPESYAEGNGNFTNFTWKSAFWVFNFVSNWAYTRYKDMIVDIQKVQSELENGFKASIPAVDQEAEKLYKKSPKKAREYITDFSVREGNRTVDRWRQLGEYLFVKYMDGNVKYEKDGKFKENGTGQCVQPMHPRYPDDWYRRIVNETGDRLKEKKLPGEK